MYPDATTSAVQIGQPNPRQQGAFMNWRSWASEVFSCSILFLVLVGWDYLNGKAPHPSAQDYIWIVILIAAVSIGGVGFKELDRIGYRKVKHKLLAFFIALLVLPIITFFIIRNLLHLQIAGLDLAYRYFVIPFFILWAAVFPLSLYLNRRKNKSTSQSTVANAS
jgi:hypothetical protein